MYTYFGQISKNVQTQVIIYVLLSSLDTLLSKRIYQTSHSPINRQRFLLTYTMILHIDDVIWIFYENQSSVREQSQGKHSNFESIRASLLLYIICTLSRVAPNFVLCLLTHYKIKFLSQKNRFHFKTWGSYLAPETFLFSFAL